MCLWTLIYAVLFSSTHATSQHENFPFYDSWPSWKMVNSSVNIFWILLDYFLTKWPGKHNLGIYLFIVTLVLTFYSSLITLYHCKYPWSFIKIQITVKIFVCSVKMSSRQPLHLTTQNTESRHVLSSRWVKLFSSTHELQLVSYLQQYSMCVVSTKITPICQNLSTISCWLW